MAWSSYTDSLMGYGHFEAVTICGIQGGIWAKSPASFNVTDAEILAIVAGMKNPSGVQSNGVWVGGVKYMYIRSDTKFLYGAKGKCGVACARAKTCILIGKHGENQQSGNASNSLTKMAEYLEGAGY